MTTAEREAQATRSPIMHVILSYRWHGITLCGLLTAFVVHYLCLVVFVATELLRVYLEDK